MTGWWGDRSARGTVCRVEGRTADVLQFDSLFPGLDQSDAEQLCPDYVQVSRELVE